MKRLLETSANHILEVLADTQEILVALDASARVQYITPSVLDALGYEPGELVGRCALDLVHPQDVDHGRPVAAKLLDQTDSPVRGKFRVKHKDGTWRHFGSVAYNYLDRPGIESIILHVRDLSLRQDSHEEPEKREAYYRTLLESSKDLMTVVDRDGNVLYVNGRIETALGYTAEEYIDISPFSIMHPADVEKGMETFQRLLLEEGVTVETEFRLRHKDGTWRWFESVTRSLFGDPLVRGILSNLFDITERKLAQEALARREEHYRRLLDSTCDLITIVNQEAKILYVNSAVERILGYTVHEIMSSEALLLVHPEDMAHSAEMLASLLEHPRKYTSTVTRVRHKDGSWRWLEARNVNLADDPSIGGILTAAHDVTDRMRAEAREQSFGRIIDESLNEVYVFDAETLRFKLVNRGARENLGYTIDELQGMTPVDLKPLTLNEFKQLIQPLETDEVEFIEFTSLHRRKDGTAYPVEVHLQRTTHDMTPAYVAMINDITDHVHSEKALRESESRYRLLAENVQDVIWTMNLDLEYTYVSPSVEHFLGVSVEEELRQSVEDFLTPLSSAKVRDLLKEVRIMEQSSPGSLTGSQTIELEFNHKDGRRLTAEVKVSFLRDGDGNPIGILGVTRDISDRKKAQEEQRKWETKIQQAQKMESLGILAGGIAHDFNNLLLGILGNAELTLSDLKGGMSNQQNLQDIVKSSQRAADLCKQLLAYSGRGSFIMQPVNLSVLVEDISHLLGVAVSKKAVLRYVFTPNLPSIEADVTQLRQIAMNLITNASDALGEKQGVISVSTGITECDEKYLSQTYLSEPKNEGAYVFLEVSDTGRGMDKETQGKIFDPFFTTKPGGHGLGMAAVLGIVKGHEGAISVSSEPEKGTTIRVLFPASQLPAGALPEQPSTDETWKGSGTILYVDDEEILRRLGIKVFERLGFRVLTAADGREAVDLFRSHQDEIEIVILDMMMPYLNGEEAFREMRHIKPNVRAILTSGYSEHEATRHFQGQGLLGFIQKPYRPAELVSLVRQALES